MLEDMIYKKRKYAVEEQRSLLFIRLSLHHHRLVDYICP